MRAKCIQSITNQSVEPDDNRSESEDDQEDAMKIDSKSAVNSGEALAMLDKSFSLKRRKERTKFCEALLQWRKRSKKWK